MDVSRTEATEWASWFRALGDPTRLLILYLLAGERKPRTVGEITARLDVGQSTVSHHLAVLAETRFVLMKPVGTSTQWTVNTRCIDCFPSAAEIVMGRIPPEFTETLECTNEQPPTS
jgi:DNA-binding transcriptional ArsR family regulator